MIRSSRRGIFGAPIGGPIAFDPIMNIKQPEPAIMPDPTAPKPLSTGRMIAGGIGDALQRWAGGQATFAPMLAQRQEQATQVAAEQRRQAAQFSTWQQQQEYKSAHPDPVAPSALERNYGFLEGQQNGLGRTYAQNFANNGGGAPQIMNIPGVGVVSVPRQTTQQPAGPPSAAVDHLRKNPEMAADFDAKYGPGASSSILGGAGSGPRPFR